MKTKNNNRKSFLRGLGVLALGVCFYSTAAVALDFDKEIAEQETVTVTIVDGLDDSSNSLAKQKKTT